MIFTYLCWAVLGFGVVFGYRGLVDVATGYQDAEHEAKQNIPNISDLFHDRFGSVSF